MANNFKPARAGMNLSHPIDGVMADEGGDWREDQFTLRRLRDQDIERIEAPEDAAPLDGEILPPEHTQEPDNSVPSLTFKGA